MKIETIKSSPLAKGKAELLAYMEGKPLSRGQAMKAKCYECMGGYTDGKVDCKVSDCPLYGFMPYRQNPIVVASARKKPVNLDGLTRWRQRGKGESPDHKENT